ncbi:MAG TPA: phytoene/squalene synthase family protein [Saprospiraceae bacterium]|nr:phytoene/squalene synthase family protein [Saprospiraceae bacterium]
MDKLYHSVCIQCSRLITKRYSTSFSMGIRVFEKKFRDPVYAIYGFVRFADEIVDTFHGKNKKALLERFRKDTYAALDEGVSLNPVLHSFQHVVNIYGIEREHIDAFLDSMEMDLYEVTYDCDGLKKYIYGSAEVVGLMCLKVFCHEVGNYDELKDYACALGSAFQKINFLRDIQSDFKDRGRTYFPDIDFNCFTEKEKLEIEEDIKKDFDYAYIGIRKLPKGVRLGVYLAYVYYIQLFSKIKNASPEKIKSSRIRVRNRRKIYLLAKSTVKHRLDLL